MKSTVVEIEDSLALYRDLSAQANATALGVLIDTILEADYFEDESGRSEDTDEDMMQERDETLASILDNIIGDKVEELTIANDILIRFEESKPKYSLDGTVGGEMEDEERATLTTAYCEAVETALRGKAPEEVRGVSSSAVPAEWTDRTTTVRDFRLVYKIYSGWESWFSVHMSLGHQNMRRKLSHNSSGHNLSQLRPKFTFIL